MMVCVENTIYQTITGSNQKMSRADDPPAPKQSEHHMSTYGGFVW